MNKSRNGAIVLIIISAIFALVGTAMRWRAERDSRMVGIAVDDQQVLQIAADSAFSPLSILNRLRQAGATSLSISEQSVEDLILSGDIMWRAPNALTVANTNLLQRLNTRLGGQFAWSAKLGKPAQGKVMVSAPAPQGGWVSFQSNTTPAQLRVLMVGLDRRMVSAAQQSGLQVIARLRNSPVATKAYIRMRLDDAVACGAGVVIFNADEILGFRDLIDYTSEQMKARELMYGSVEMGKQKGDMALTAKMRDLTVRVHSIPSAEMGTLTPVEMIDRFERAAKERNIRLCYVRIPSVTDEDAMAGMAGFVSQLRYGIQKGGLAVGRPKPVMNPSVPPVVNALAGAGGLVALLLLIETLLVLPGSAMLPFLVFLLGAVLGLTGETGLKVCALAAAIAMPSLGLISMKLTQECRCSPIQHALKLFGSMVVWSLLGALLIVGCLANLDFMIKANQFAGIKFAHLAPILATAWYWGLNVNECKNTKQLVERLKAFWKSIAGYPITIGLAGGLLIGLVLIAIVLMRTGNEPGVGVSPIEMKFRSLLEWVMVVRPRTKEFMVGHPAMLVALTLAALGRPKWWWLPLLLLGALGQASLLNTFCHIHTPLGISVLRMVYGVILGGVIGYVLSRLAVKGVEKAEALAGNE
ncbi:MAG: DUF5693 family protein [Armatimonadota bacterium]